MYNICLHVDWKWVFFFHRMHFSPEIAVYSCLHFEFFGFGVWRCCWHYKSLVQLRGVTGCACVPGCKVAGCLFVLTALLPLLLKSFKARMLRRRSSSDFLGEQLTNSAKQDPLEVSSSVGGAGDREAGSTARGAPAPRLSPPSLPWRGAEEPRGRLCFAAPIWAAWCFEWYEVILGCLHPSLLIIRLGALVSHWCRGGSSHHTLLLIKSPY